jgi:hypothetical protein
MRYLSIGLLSLCFAAVPVMVGCDRTVSHDETTEVKPDGTTVQKETTVKKDANGNVIKDESKTVDKP